jgi:methyl-accepting chemotaxis protein
MTCVSKSCQWIITLSQLSVATVIVYAGLVVGVHMESWSESFKKGSVDLHSIRENMNTIAYSMESINRDMDKLNSQTERAVNVTLELSKDIKQMNQQLNRMNYNVGSIQRNFSPQGMARSFMPF